MLCLMLLDFHCRLLLAVEMNREQDDDDFQFGEMPDDDDSGDSHGLDNDMDAVNDETFGSSDVGGGDDLEQYAAQVPFPLSHVNFVDRRVRISHGPARRIPVNCLCRCSRGLRRP